MRLENPYSLISPRSECASDTHSPHHSGHHHSKSTHHSSHSHFVPVTRHFRQNSHGSFKGSVSGQTSPQNTPPSTRRTMSTSLEHIEMKGLGSSTLNRSHSSSDDHSLDEENPSRRPSAFHTPEPVDMAELPEGVRPWDFAGRGSSVVEFMEMPPTSPESPAMNGHGRATPPIPTIAEEPEMKASFFSSIMPRIKFWKSSGPDGDGDEGGQSSSNIKKKKKTSHLLSQWPATAICGNDITSSCLYVAGEQSFIKLFFFQNSVNLE
jgi:hypothetical protein